MKISDKAFLQQILLDLKNMNVADPAESINGSDAVDYLVALYRDVKKQLKVIK